MDIREKFTHERLRALANTHTHERTHTHPHTYITHTYTIQDTKQIQVLIHSGTYNTTTHTPYTIP